MTSLWIDLDGLANMRDLGGTPAADGARIQPGRLVRSDNLQDLTDDDVQHLIDHGVTDVVDLRSDVELRITGPGPLSRQRSITHHHHSMFKSREVAVEDALVLPWRDAVAKQRKPMDSNHWSDHYLGYLAERPDSVSAALRVIAEADGAVVVHCAAGKDRTGTIVAMALAVAGVSDEDIATDYVATAERIERVVARLSTMPAYAENLDGRPLSDHVPQPEAMLRVLEGVRATSGSVEGWLRGQGWSQEDLERLRTRLTDPAGK